MFGAVTNWENKFDWRLLEEELVSKFTTDGEKEGMELLKLLIGNEVWEGFETGIEGVETTVVSGYGRGICTAGMIILSVFERVGTVESEFIFIVNFGELLTLKDSSSSKVLDLSVWIRLFKSEIERDFAKEYFFLEEAFKVLLKRRSKFVSKGI